MPIIDEQIRRARRRLACNVMFQRAALGVVISASAWALAVLVTRAFALPLPLIPSIVLAVLTAAAIGIVGTVIAGVDRLQAAISIDRAAGLKERVSTALEVQSSADPFARAAVHDAERVATSVHVPTHLPFRSPELWPWSLSTLAVAALLYLFMPQLDLLAGEPEADVDKQAVQAERASVQLEVRTKLKELKKRFDENDKLRDLAGEKDALELPDKPGDTPDDIRREAVKRLDNVADKVRRKSDSERFDALKALKRDLAKLQTPRGDDPGAKLAKALASGDMHAAKSALSDLKKQLEDAARNARPEDKAKLAEMQQRLDQLAKQLTKLSRNAQLEKELEHKAGLTPEQAKKLLEQLSKMDPKQLEKELQKRLGDKGLSPEQIKKLAKKVAQQQKSQQQLKSLAKAMAKAAQAAAQSQSGDGDSQSSQAGAAALSDAMDQLSDLEMADQMFNELQATLAELEDAKNVVQGACPKCGRFGCNGNCDGPPDWDKIGGQGPRAGFGFGSKIGKQRAAHQYLPTKVNARTGRGQIIGQMLIDGPQVRGQASAEAEEALDAALRDAQDAIDRERVPRQYENVLKNYFLELAGLSSRGDAAAAAKANPAGADESAGAAAGSPKPKKP